jgi:hypothetical protein
MQSLLFDKLRIHTKKDNQIQKGWAIFIKRIIRLMNENSAIGTKNFKSWETGLGYSFITMPL